MSYNVNTEVVKSPRRCSLALSPEDIEERLVRTPRRASLDDGPKGDSHADGSQSPRRASSSYGSNPMAGLEGIQMVSREGARLTARPTLSSYYNTSSSDETDQQKSPRRSRRPPQPEPKAAKIPTWKKRSEEYLNHSFNMSFGSYSSEGQNSMSNQETNLSLEDSFVEDINGLLQTVGGGDDDGHPDDDDDDLAAVTDHLTTDEYFEDDSQLVLEEETTVTSSHTLVIEVPTGPGKLYECARQFDWKAVQRECSAKPWTAKFVSPEDGTTALHLAVMSRANPALRDGVHEHVKPAPLGLIEQLILACPEAAIIRCTMKRYTPLIYACLVTEVDYDMDDSADMVKILMKHAPHSTLVFTDDGLSALDVHIISYSRLHKQKAEVYSSTGRSSAVVLRTLLEGNPSLADARPYGNRLRGPVELLYRCNVKEFKEASGSDIVAASKGGKSVRGSFASSVVSTLSEWWAWKWGLVLLKVTSIPIDDDQDDDPGPFSALHAATQIIGCPVPIISLAMDAYAEQVKHRSPRNGKYNCPLHEVCSWVTDDIAIDGDSFVQKRKSKAIALLLDEFPKAARMTNNMGETPLQLAVETCTPWDKGLELLVKAFPKALLIPRCLDHVTEDGPLATAIALHDDDVGSVGSDEDEWQTESIEAVEGMYPFMIAAALSHVSDRRKPTLSYEGSARNRADFVKSLRNKDLESLRSIYGLLRARPAALSLFLEDEKKRPTEESCAGPEEHDESSNSTSDFFEENEGQASFSEQDVSCGEYTDESV
jgi:hypothetical protein